MKEIAYIFTTIPLILLSCGGLSDLYSDLYLEVPICVDTIRGNDANSGRGWNSSFKTLSAAIDYSNSNNTGGEIWVAGTQTLSAAITITKNIDVYGGFKGNESRREERDLYNKTIVSSPLSLSTGLIDNQSGTAVSAVFDGFSFKDNSSVMFYFDSKSSLVIRNSEIHGQAPINTYPVVLMNNVGIMKFENCIISDFMTANSSCVKISSADYVEMKNTIFINNSLSASGITYGGAVYLSSVQNVLIDSCVFSNNCTLNAFPNGGALYATLCAITISNSRFEGNYVSSTSNYSNGGALYLAQCEVFITNSLFDKNNALAPTSAQNASGGAMFLSQCSSAWIQNSTIINNTAEQGGGIYLHSSGKTSIGNCILSENIAVNETGSGGGLYCISNTCSIESTLFSANACTYTSGNTFGGAITDYGYVSIKKSNFTANSIQYGNGGAIYIPSGSEISIEACSFSKNSTAYGSGGAVYLSSSSPYVVTSSLFYNNNSISTAVNSGGGGIYLYTTASHVVSNLTFYKNSATGSGNAAGGALFSLLSATNLIVYNSAFYDNTDGSSDGSSYNIHTGGSLSMYNCFYNDGVSAGTTLSPYNSFTGTSLPFTSVDSDNSKFLYPSLTLINKGCSPIIGLSPYDLAGNSRIVGSSIDIGAYEAK